MTEILTGDLVRVNPKEYGSTNIVMLWTHPELHHRAADDMMICRCSLGMFVGATQVFAQRMETLSQEMTTMALVLDCATQKMGWCRLKFIRKVE